MKRITGLDWPLAALAACLLALTAAGAFWITSFDDGNAGVIPLLQAAPYALAAWLVVRGRQDRADSNRALASILIVGFAMRLVLLPGTPVSTDIYRYVWDGRVQGAGINPYLLSAGRPGADGSARRRDLPVHQPRRLRPDHLSADSADRLLPGHAHLRERRLHEGSPCSASRRSRSGRSCSLLRAAGAASRVLLYAWHPLPLWEFASSGHVDVVAIAFLLLALAGRRAAPAMLAGVALASGALVKYFPARRGAGALANAGIGACRSRSSRRSSQLYLPYLGAGTKVLGFLAGTSPRKASTRGHRACFLWRCSARSCRCRRTALPRSTSPVAAGGHGGARAALVVMRAQAPGADLAGAMLLAVAFTFLFSPHYAWYFAGSSRSCASSPSSASSTSPARRALLFSLIGRPASWRRPA